MKTLSCFGALWNESLCIIQECRQVLVHTDTSLHYQEVLRMTDYRVVVGCLYATALQHMS